MEERIRDIGRKLDDRFDRLMAAFDGFKNVQELKEFRIRMEERGRLST